LAVRPGKLAEYPKLIRVLVAAYFSSSTLASWSIRIALSENTSAAFVRRG
jgi:hypothetical protein